MCAQKTAVLLVNLGTPDNPTPFAIRQFLRSFLWDKRVVELPRLLWWVVLNGFILPFRASRLVKAYRSIWLAEGSPLRVYTQKLADDLKKQLSICYGEHISVFAAMTYGEPHLSEIIKLNLRAGVKKLIVLPMFPQSSSTTTAAVFDKVSQILCEQRQIPSFTFIHEYCEDLAYIEGLANHIKMFWASQASRNHLVFSFHGIPLRNILLGDDYAAQCFATASRIANILKIPENEWSIGFQSRFGKSKWTEPYTDKLLIGLLSKGKQSVDVVAPGFSVDCLETLEELDVFNKKNFLKAGGKSFRYIPALNASALHTEMLAKILKKYVSLDK